MDAIVKRGIGHHSDQGERQFALVAQPHFSKNKHLVKGILGHGLAIGVQARGLRVLRMSPHRNHIPDDRGRLLTGNHVDRYGDGDQNCRNYCGPDQVAGTLGQFLAKSRIVDCFRCVLMKETHSALILA